MDERYNPEIEVYAEGDGHRVYFQCPRGRSGGVPIAPLKNPNGATWQWDGNRETPTLTPSINCNGAGGCGWHGWMVIGKMVEA